MNNHPQKPTTPSLRASQARICHAHPDTHHHNHTSASDHLNPKLGSLNLDLLCVAKNVSLRAFNLSLQGPLARLVLNQGNNHRVQIEEEHDKVEAQLDE